MPERATAMSRSGKSAEAVVAASVGRRAERERVSENTAISRVMRQMSARTGRAGAGIPQVKIEPCAFAFDPNRRENLPKSCDAPRGVLPPSAAASMRRLAMRLMSLLLR